MLMNKLICGDNLDVLTSDALDTASVDLIYLDPPFNSNQHYNLPFKKLGKDSTAVEAFKDIWHWDAATYALSSAFSKKRPRLRSGTTSLTSKLCAANGTASQRILSTWLYG